MFHKGDRYMREALGLPAMRHFTAVALSSVGGSLTQGLGSGTLPEPHRYVKY